MNMLALLIFMNLVGPNPGYWKTLRRFQLLATKIEAFYNDMVISSLGPTGNFKGKNNQSVYACN